MLNVEISSCILFIVLLQQYTDIPLALSVIIEKI